MLRFCLRSALCSVAFASAALLMTPAAHADLITVSVSFTGTTVENPSVQTFSYSESYTTAQLNACESSGACYNSGPPGSVLTLSPVDGYGSGTIALTVYNNGFSFNDLDQRSGISISDPNAGDLFDLRHPVGPFTGAFFGGPLIQDCENELPSSECPAAIPGAGYLTSISDTGVGQITIRPDTTVTPEPGTWVMVGTGLLGGVGVVRRRFGARVPSC